MPRTLEEIRILGLEALRDRLGQAGMIRFLRQFDNGSGNYAIARHDWVDRTTMKQLRQQVKRKRGKQSTSQRRSAR